MLEDFRLAETDWIKQAARRIGDNLATVLSNKGHASLALGGGGTPWPVYRALAARPLDWANIVIVPSDERWLPDDHAENNGRQIAEVFAPTGATIVSLFDTGHDTAKTAIGGLTDRLNNHQALPVDVAVIGLGPDGHTLSWFPGGDGLDQAIDPEGDQPLIAVQAADGGAAVATNDRISLTLPVMQAAREVILLTGGQAKIDVFERALMPGPAADYPIRALLHQDKVPVTLFHNLDI